jgi:hypothetical protein
VSEKVLLDGLLANRLININPDGHIEACSFLRKHAASNGGKPSLVKYQERAEEVAFDLLTHRYATTTESSFYFWTAEAIASASDRGSAAAVTEALAPSFATIFCSAATASMSVKGLDYIR